MPRTIKSVSSPDQPSPSVGAVGTSGTGLFVLCSDITTLSTKGTTVNPAAILDSTSTSDYHIWPLEVPTGYNWLDLYIAVLGASSTITQALKGVMCGSLRIRNAGDGDSMTPRQLPFAGTSSNWNTAIGASSQASAGPHGNRGSDMWIPLDNPLTQFNSTTGLVTPEITFPTTFAITQDLTAATATYPRVGGLSTTGASSITAHRVTSRLSVFVGGVNRVLFMPTQVAALGGSGSEGMLLGRFIV